MSSRREFLKTSTTAALGTLVAGCTSLPAARDNRAPAPLLKVGLIGCGGRGTGAAAQALAADPNVQLTAMGDAFAERLQESLAAIRTAAAAKVTVTPDTSFVGLDAFQKVIDSGVDVVLLATPPAFRPQHLRAAIDANKHVFCEKPIATDAPGVRSVLTTAAQAKAKNLAIVSGFCYRYNDGMRECMKRIHDGAVGDITSLQGVYYTNTLTTKFSGTREADWSDLEWQLRNWYNFVWLAGDQIVEQAIHNVDKIAWAMRDEMPVRAVGAGGRQVPAYGNIFDHMHVSYEYVGGQRGFLDCRQQDNTHHETTDWVTGTRGTYSRGRGMHPEIRRGRKVWQYTKTPRNMYQVEHDELFASIRNGRPINDGVQMANSTLMAIMGRMAAYTGQAITWEQALGSQESLVPQHLDWSMALPLAPRAIPGQTAFL